MQSIMFLIRKQYINKLKRCFSSVASAIITILAVFGMGSALVSSFIMKRSSLATTLSETILSGIILLLGVLFYSSFLSRDNGILTMADANFLFTGPYERRTVLAYLLISTAPASLLTSFFMCMYLPFFIGAKMSVLTFLIVLLVISLLFACIYLSYYYVYIADTEKSGVKKLIFKFFLCFLGILAAIFAVIFFYNVFEFKTAVESFFTSPLYNWVPLFGWAKWAIISLISGDIISGFFPPLGLLVLTNTILCIMLYNVKADFYEKTLEDSVKLQKILDDTKANGSADVRSIAKLRKKTSKVTYRKGAASIYSRQQLENSKLGFSTKHRDIFLGLIYVAIGKIFGLDFNFVIVMVGFGTLSMSLRDSWHLDFKKPYVFLIPDSSFKKVIFSVLPSITKTLVGSGLTIVIAGLVYKLNIQLLISYLLIMISFAVLFVFAEVLTYRIIGAGSNAMAVSFIRMIFVIATCIPAIAVCIVIAVLSGTIPNMLDISLAMFATNLLSSLLLAFLSRGIFENIEISE